MEVIVPASDDWRLVLDAPDSFGGGVQEPAHVGIVAWEITDDSVIPITPYGRVDTSATYVLLGPAGQHYVLPNGPVIRHQSEVRQYLGGRR